MNLLKTIKITNFRGFDHFEIEGFNQINLLIGKNNCGKSSLLEALFLLIGMSNPILPENINRLRGLNFKSAEDFKLLFYKLKLNNSPEFESSFSDQSNRKLKLNPIFKKSTNHTSKQNIGSGEFSIDASTASPNISGLELEFELKHRHNQKKIFKIIFDPSEIIQKTNNEYKEEMQAVYITGSNNESGLLMRYSDIVKRKKGDIVFNAIQKIDDNIESIQPFPDGIYFSYKEIEEMIPSNIAGDGVRKFLNIITAIADKPNSIVLIDEIENGLHYSAHKALWESIINISKEFNVQLFITSHNIETLKCLSELLGSEEYKDTQTKLNVFNISHTQKAGIKAYKYSYEGFKDAIINETEIR